MKKYFRFQKKPAGESLLETIIAITILSIILVSVFGLLTQALSANKDIKNRVIALNYAREGIEGVRNIRDTNWLRFSGDRRGKWLCLNSPDCTQKIETAKYKLNYSTQYSLEKKTDAFDLTNTVYEVASGSIFHRQLDLEPETKDVCPSNKCDESRLRITSRVKWLEEGNVRTVTLETYLYDFYGRNSY